MNEEVIQGQDKSVWSLIGVWQLVWEECGIGRLSEGLNVKHKHDKRQSVKFTKMLILTRLKATILSFARCRYAMITFSERR